MPIVPPSAHQRDRSPRDYTLKSRRAASATGVTQHRGGATLAGAKCPKSTDSRHRLGEAYSTRTLMVSGLRELATEDKFEVVQISRVAVEHQPEFAVPERLDGQYVTGKRGIEGRCRRGSRINRDAAPGLVTGQARHLQLQAVLGDPGKSSLNMRSKIARARASSPLLMLGSSRALRAVQRWGGGAVGRWGGRGGGAVGR